jgi:hypothetical protein
MEPISWSVTLTKAGKACEGQTMQLILPIGLYHPLDGITNPKYKLLHFLTNKKFCKGKRQ